MAQVVIDGVLFSPVLAHSLEPGDLVHLQWANVRITTPPRPVRRNQTDWLFVDATVVNDPDGDKPTWLRFWPNESVLRAVGARAGRVGAR